MNVLKTTTAAIALTLAGSAAFAESHVAADGTATDMANDAAVATENAADATVDAASDATAGMAEAVDGDMQNFDLTTSENLIRSRDIVGGEIFRKDADTADATWNDNLVYNGIGDGWENIGSIEDVVLSKNGQMIGVVGSVGGFLGLGDKMVLIPVTDVRLSAIDDGQYALVTDLTQADIEAAQDVDEGFWD